MKLTAQQKQKLKKMLENQNMISSIKEDMIEIMLLEVNNSSDMGFYVQDIETRDNCIFQNTYLDAYEDELSYRHQLVNDLVINKNVEKFCALIKYIETSFMTVDLEYNKEDAEKRLSCLKTDLAREILVENNQ